MRGGPPSDLECDTSRSIKLVCSVGGGGGPQSSSAAQTTAVPQVSAGMALLAAMLLLHLLLLTSFAERDAGSSVSSSVYPRDNGGSLTAVTLTTSQRPREVRSLRAGAGGQLLQSPSASQPAIFATENSTVVTAQIGSTTTLPCTVKKFGNGVVSWVRRKDFHLLTVGLATYSSDDRFLVEHTRHLQNWGLQIKSVQPRDAGFYECQVSSHPPTSIFIELRIVEASAEIAGGAPDLHIKSGSTLRLTCSLRHSTEPPVFVFWYHDARMINYDRERGVRVENAGRAGSALVLDAAAPGDSGNYTCVPSNARPASINVHVLNAGEKPAAMQHGSRSSRASSSNLGHWLLLFTCTCILTCSRSQLSLHR